MPNDLTLAITYTGGGMTAPGNVVIDALGNAYVGNAPSQNGAAGTDSIVGFGSDGTILTGSTGYTSGIHAPNALAIDQLGNIWSTDQATGSFSDEVVKLNSTGVKQFAFSDNATSGVQGIAIDASNNAWVVNQNTYKIEQVLAGGTRTLAPVSTRKLLLPHRHRHRWHRHSFRRRHRCQHYRQVQLVGHGAGHLRPRFPEPADQHLH